MGVIFSTFGTMVSSTFVGLVSTYPPGPELEVVVGVVGGVGVGGVEGVGFSSAFSTVISIGNSTHCSPANVLTFSLRREILEGRVNSKIISFVLS